MKNILVVANDQEIFRIIHACFEGPDDVCHQVDKDGALQLIRRQHVDFVFIDLNLLREPDQGNGFKAVLLPFWVAAPNLEIIVMSAPAQIREAVMAVKAGAGNFLTYPLHADEVKYVTESLYESTLMQSELTYLRKKFWQVDSLELIQTKSPLMQEVYDKVRSVAPTISTVLIVGETGTGKGVLAKLIHQHSNRSNDQFISVHCGAIPETLMESELFGHEKGAFTGATRRKIGKFEIAKEGTIFLDEIGTLTATAQIKFLQILQDRAFQRVGGTETIEANVRIMAATNADLRQMCDAGLFRKDLFYRLNVFPIEIPPLRERVEDILPLCGHLLTRAAARVGKQTDGVSPEAAKVLLGYNWPGNVRELENVMERAVALSQGAQIQVGDLPPVLLQRRADALTGAAARKLTLSDLEREYILQVLSEEKGNKSRAAVRLGLDRKTLYRKLEEYRQRQES